MKIPKSISGVFVVAVFAVIVLGSVVACSNSDNNEAGVTQTEAADAIEASLTADSNGMARMASDASALADSENIYTARPDINCGQQYSINYHPVYSGTYYSYDYNGTRTYTLQCASDSSPQALVYTSSIQGTYQTPRMYSNDSSSATVTITSLDPAQATASITGSYIRNGHQESRVRQMRSFDSVITYNLNNMVVNKTTREITGGTATVSIVGTGSLGGNFTYNGSITFNDDHTATLVINGTVYTITL